MCFEGKVCQYLERRRLAFRVRPRAPVVPSIAIFSEMNVGNRNAVEGEWTKVVEQWTSIRTTAEPRRYRATGANDWNFGWECCAPAACPQMPGDHYDQPEIDMD
jgi:hypothetical protein